MVETGRPEIGGKSLQALRKEIARKHGKTPEQLFEERERRVRDAIELKAPDRVPMVINSDPANRGGLPHATAFDDPAEIKAMVESVRRYAEY